jgi:membrane peptidoglycan carboxypeptidase
MEDTSPPIPARPAIRRRASARRDLAAGRHRVAVQAVAIVLVAFVSVGAVLSGALAAGWMRAPRVDGLLAQPLPSDTLVYDRTGKVLLADLHPAGYQHYEQAASDTGTYLPEATVAIEDANFWNEPGVDPFSILRAGWTDFRAHSIVQGGSTITQQLVKRRVVGSDQSVSRKVKEAALAVQVSTQYSKRQILGMYLDSIFYGSTAYGAEAASRIYFRTDTSRLDLAQAAMLAGLPQDPTLLNPLTHWQAAKQRQREVLDAMVRQHMVSRSAADRAFAEDLTAPSRLFGPSPTNLAPAFVDYVKGELTDRFGSDAVQRGLTVVTTLDWELQQQAQKAVTDGVQANRGRDLTDGALVSVDPHTGGIVALVGSAGPNVPGGQYDMAVWPPRNPGSSFKMFTYTAAIDSRRYTMVSPIVDAPISVLMPGTTKAYAPKNYDLGYHGTCQLQACLGNSLNIPAVEVELGVGIQDVVGEARRLGAPPYQQHGKQYTTDDAATSFGPSLTLGGYGETPLQMATGASVLAANGVLHEPQAILSATSPAGQLFKADTTGHQVLDPGVAYIVSQMLSDSSNRTTIFGRNTPLTLPDRRAAAKTGTTDDFADAWTVGYTPSLATAIWMGNTDFHPMARGSDGIFVAAPAWHDFMQGALDHMGKGDEWFSTPAGVDVRRSGGRDLYFLSGTSPSTQPPALPSWVHLGGGGGDSHGQGCRTWTWQGGTYWACSPGNSGLPGDPGGGGGNGNNGD